MQNYDYKITAAGRVNIIGEHIDYCGGKVLPASLSLCNTVYIKANGTNKINIKWTTLDVEVSLDIDKLDSYKETPYAKYIAGSIYEYMQAGYKVVGVDMLQDCKVPFGSGLSSSASIEVSTISAMATVADEKLTNKEIALLAQKAEREYVGVNCGIMDQYASACGKKDNAVLLNCKLVESSYIPFDLGDNVLVIIDTNKPHNLVESKYNERRKETEIALEVLKEKLNVQCLADISVEEFEKYSYLLKEPVKSRAKHVIYECDRVEKATVAMKNKDPEMLGKLLNESHNSLSKLYEVTGFELDTLQSLAVKSKYCLGSRMTGAGFGGSTISIVNKDKVEEFKNEVLDEYRKLTGYVAKCYVANVSDGITVTKL